MHRRNNKILTCRFCIFTNYLSILVEYYATIITCSKIGIVGFMWLQWPINDPEICFLQNSRDTIQTAVSITYCAHKSSSPYMWQIQYGVDYMKPLLCHLQLHNYIHYLSPSKHAHLSCFFDMLAISNVIIKICHLKISLAFSIERFTFTYK